MADLNSVDAEQARLMEERVVVVDKDDKVVRYASKKETHLNENISTGLLHRAFSLFLFDKDNRLLLQQRAAAKITFPSHWTNTVCSHPIHFTLEGDGAQHIATTYGLQQGDTASQPELEEKEALGVRYALFCRYCCCCLSTFLHVIIVLVQIDS